MNRATIPLAALLLWCFVSTARAQPGSFPIEITLRTTTTQRGPISELANSVLVDIENRNPGITTVYLEISIQGLSADINNINLNNFSDASAYELQLTSGPNPFTLRTLEARYGGLDLEQLDDSSLLPWQRDLIEEQRILPAGRWRICITAFSSESLLQLSDNSATAHCLTFDITPRTPPRIVSPVDLANGTWVAEIANDALLVNWIIDEMGGNTYLLEVKEFMDFEAVQAFNDAHRPQDQFGAMITLDAIDGIGALQYNLADRGIDLEPEHWYAIRVTASSAQSPFADQGRSNIVVFTYGVEVTGACQRPSVSASVIYPVPGDTLPYIDPYVLVEFTPACPSTIEADASLRIESSDAGVAGGTWDFAPNRWRSGPGPGAFLRSYFTRMAPADHDTYWYPEGSGYERFLPLIDFDSRHDFVRGAHYSASVNIEFTHRDMALGGVTYKQPIDVPGLGAGTGGFVTGMPRPRLDYPAHDQVIRTGEALDFRFTTGQAPSRPLPPFKSMRIDGPSGAAAMPWLKVVEKCVFQLSKEPDFAQDQLLQSTLYRIQVNTADVTDEFASTEPIVGTFSTRIDETPERRFDESRILAQLYRPLEQSYTVVEADTLYWRVVWLRDVDAINTRDLLAGNITLAEADIYHVSPVRRLIVDDDGPEGTPTPPVASTPSENDPTDCTTGCTPTPPTDRTAVTTVAGLTTFKIGYFAVQDLELTSSSGGTLRGTGSITVDFMFGAKFRVEFDDVRVNAAGAAVAGTVKGLEATTPFELDDINSALSRAAGALGQESRVNEWLQEAPGTRLLSEIVGGDPVRLPVGLDRKIDGKNLLIGITALDFTTEGATVKLLYEQQFDFLADDTYLSLGGEVCLKPSGFGAEVLLHLNRDLTFDANPNDTVVNSLRLKGSSGSAAEIKNTATHIEFDCACVKSFGLKFEGDLSRKRFVKEDAAGQIVEGAAVGFRFGVRLDRTTACDPEVLEEIPEELRGRFRENGFIVNVDFDPFQFKGLEDWGFRIDDAAIDFSSSENPAGMVFPPEYTDADFGIPDEASAEITGLLRNTWTGFYFREFSVRGPHGWYDRGGTESDFKAGLSNMIIDAKGLSVNLFIQNLVGTETGNLGGWAFSVDTVGVRIAKNVFREGMIGGDLGFPLLAKDSVMQYTALLAYRPQTEEFPDRDRFGMLLAVETAAELRFPAMLGTARLTDNSFMGYRLGYTPPGAAQLATDAFATGDTWSVRFDGEIDVSTASNSSVSSLATTLNFTGMEFRLAYSTTRGLYDKHFALASPQKWMGGAPPESGGEKGMAGFPVTVRNFGFDLDLRPDHLGGSLSFEPTLNFMGEGEGGLSASAQLRIGMGYNPESKRLVFDGLSVDCISIGVTPGASGGEGGGGSETAGLTLQGRLCFYNDETSRGVKGDLHVGLPIADVTMAAEFGARADFRYWYVDGKVVLESGIPLGAIQLVGIGGGFYHNMRLGAAGVVGTETAQGYNRVQMGTATAMHTAPGGPMPDTLTAAPPDGRAPASGLTPSGFAPVPMRGSNVFKLVLPIATSGDASVFNMDVSVSATVQAGRGLTQFKLIGDGYVMADVPERATAPVKTDIIVQFDKFEDRKVFAAQFNAYADIRFGSALSVRGITDAVALDGVTRPLVVSVAFNLEKPNVGASTWSFKMGTPSSPAGLSVRLNDKELAKVRHYLQVGNNIEAGFMPMPDIVREILGDLETGGEGGELVGGNSFTSPSTAITSQTSDRVNPNTSGFAMGLSLEANLDIDAFLLYATLKFGVGFDINLLKYAQAQCTLDDGRIIDPFGYNGWYATGQIYAGIEGDIGLQIKLIRTRRFSLFKLGAAFQIQGGFPNPMWAEGRAAIRYSVLGGLIDGSANMQFALGDKCSPGKTDPFGFPLIESVYPDHRARDVSYLAQPKVNFVVPMDEVLAMPVLDEDGGVQRIEYLKPYVYRPALRFAAGATTRTRSAVTHQVIYSDDQKMLRLKTSRPQPNKEVEVHVEIRAKELVGSNPISGRWVDAQWPAGAAQSGTWSTDTTWTYNIGEMPDKIEDRLYTYSIPVKDQRFYLQGAIYARSNHVEFGMNLCEDYFYETDAGGSYDYVLALYPYDGGASQEVPVTLRCRGARTRVSFELPPRLAAETIFNAVIVRKKRRAQNSSTANPLLANLDVDRRAPALQGTDFRLLASNTVGAGDFRTTVNFLTNARRLQPGSEESETHFPIFQWYFRTSRFNTVREKFAGATVSVRQVFELEQYVFIEGTESCDAIDLLPYPIHDDGAVVSHRGPLLASYPTYDNDYWRDAATPFYNQVRSFDQILHEPRYVTYRETVPAGNRNWEINASRTQRTMSLTERRAGGGGYVGEYDASTPGIPRASGMNHAVAPSLFGDLWARRYRPMQGTYIRSPLNGGDVDRAWSATLDRWAQEWADEQAARAPTTLGERAGVNVNPVNSAFAAAAMGGFGTRRAIPAPTPTYTARGTSTSTTTVAYRPVMMAFRHDLQQLVWEDYQTYLAGVKAVENYRSALFRQEVAAGGRAWEWMTAEDYALVFPLRAHFNASLYTRGVGNMTTYLRSLEGPSAYRFVGRLSSSSRGRYNFRVNEGGLGIGELNLAPANSNGVLLNFQLD